MIGQAARKPSKYRAVKTIRDGITFASKREAARYNQLRLLERGERIRGLKLQHEYRLEVNGLLICKYRSDFEYEELRRDGAWLAVTEDCKGFKTPAYRLKRKLMMALHGIEIRES
jgi:hypothetical protein